MPDSTYDRLHGYYLEDLSLGMSDDFTKTITESDILIYAGVSGDNNPLHLDEEFASQTRFKGRISHGMLTTSLWSTIVGTKLPGPGSAYMRQDMKFLKPVRIGDSVTATMTVVEVNVEKQQVTLDAECLVEGELVATGRGLVWVPKKQASAPNA